MILFSELQRITGGQNLSFSKDRGVTQLFIDSRKPVVEEGSVFFAIRGDHHNGHDYIQHLHNAGVRQFVVEEASAPGTLADSNMLLVRSSRDALQLIAAHHRNQFTIPVVGITGSNGKTIVKEWIYQLLSSRFTVVKNPGSYNSQLGVPLSVWQMQQHHQVGVFEAGISTVAEMEKLARVINPTIGIFTNIGSAHDVGFSSPQEKIREKLKLFRNVNLLIYCSDNRSIHEEVSKLKIKSMPWGFSDEAEIKISGDKNHFTVVWGNVSFKVHLPFNDPASVENCFHCIALMLHLGYTEDQINAGIKDLRAVPMRLELKEGINQCQVVDDSYNNDFAGLQISLEFLGGQYQKSKRCLILSDIPESGLDQESLVKRISDLAETNNIQRFVGIGPVLSAHKNLFRKESFFYSDTTDFLNHFDFDQLQNEVILVKGARKFQFEKIIARLQRKVHGTVMEIDLGAIVYNLNLFRSKIKPSTKMMVMVKAFAYGSGSTEIANILQYHKVNYLGVAYADEGVELRKNNITLPVMVMNPSEDSFGQILGYNLEPEIYSFKILHSILNFLNGKDCSIHIKLDTGMHRLGFEESDLKDLIHVLQSNKNLRVASIFTHLAGADEREHDDFSKKQGHDFIQHADRISKALGYKPLYHALNSPGILRLPELQMDMVRLGIGLYGVDPTPYKFDELKPVATLKTLISQVKHLEIGETIGYGRKGKVERKMKIATIAVGYADGFNRAFSRGVGEVLIHGKRAKVIGNVCMDMTMIDITDIDAQEGDEVIVFGEGLPIHEIASKIGTIPYEILTSTSERVKRIFVAESI